MDPDGSDQPTDAEYGSDTIDHNAPTEHESGDGIVDRAKKWLGLSTEDASDHRADLMDPAIPEDSWAHKNDRVYADGSVMHTGPESPYFRTEKTITHPDGSVDYLDDHGVREQKLADGTDIDYWADGYTTTRDPDGSEEVMAPDGSIVDEGDD